MYVQRCSRCLKPAVWLCSGALPAAQIADGVDARVLLPAFPDIRRGVTDAQVVSRRDTFAGHITLLFGHYNGVGIYLIDAPHAL